MKDPTQQHTLYTKEVDASLFTTDTTTLCDYNITADVLNSDTILENESKIIQPMEIHSQSKHKYRNVFGDSNIQYHDFNNGDALTFKNKYTALLEQELQNPYWCYMTLSQLKVTKYILKWILKLCHMQCIFLVMTRPSQKLTMSHTR